MTVQATSREAYHSPDNIISMRKDAAMIEKVILLYGPCHAGDVQKITGLSVNIVSGRMNDLLKDKRIEIVKDAEGDPIKVKNPGTNRMVMQWRVLKPVQTNLNF